MPSIGVVVDELVLVGADAVVGIDIVVRFVHPMAMVSPVANRPAFRLVTVGGCCVPASRLAQAVPPTPERAAQNQR